MSNPKFTAHVVLYYLPPNPADAQTHRPGRRSANDFEVIRIRQDVNTPLYDATDVTEFIGEAAQDLVDDDEIRKRLSAGDYVNVSMAGELNFSSYTDFEGTTEYDMEVEPEWHFWRTLTTKEAEAVAIQEGMLPRDIDMEICPAYDDDTGEYGRLVPEETLYRITHFMRALPDGFPRGHAMAGMDGSVGIIWERADYQLYVDFRADGRTRYYYRDHQGTPVETVIQAPHDVAAIVAAVSPVARLAVVQPARRRPRNRPQLDFDRKGSFPLTL